MSWLFDMMLRVAAAGGAALEPCRHHLSSIVCSVVAVSDASCRLGGLDNYLLHTSDRKLASALGSRLKRMLEDKLIANERRTSGNGNGGGSNNSSSSGGGAGELR